jgi:probable rRNA maturation factor
MTRRTIAIDFAVESELWQTVPDVEAVITAAVSAAVAGAKLKHAPGAELSVVLTDDTGIAKINAAWRAIDKPTNVLSFPLVQPTATARAPMLGDIILAYETLDREALEAGRPFQQHLTHLAVHGLLHLFGYDHVTPDEAEAMEAMEIAILARLGIDNPYAGAPLLRAAG